ncbi:uncharacterized protein PGTG_07988 [Puccinia graminis f. sp. tritici CRL 75-36-700-3]|uniref:Uncharacterized protein n=1 Tax=Puccinia graminis f. sp. tritici (strain CRL 75-36-700-3 / race SCCL) TaxID=418459 RepID=E3KB13_PUCGT|nr:uncharacterized protein PGTG_07988 [Puccinia graminis f. sp. tritici CRL 75-36-700-3]EFP81739.2 hypothetical protein PGTG_07988 [Puccinia graminis f. sp. tritici CRL 75-36-700-3]
MRINVPNIRYHYIKLGVIGGSMDEANDLNLYRIMKASMKDWFGEVDGLDPANLTTIWSKDHRQVVIKAPVGEAHKVINSISMHSSSFNPETSNHPLNLQILSHSHCLVNLSRNDRLGI